MTFARVLRYGWMDLLTASAFPVLWLMRARFDDGTAMKWLFWPVVFELFATVALVLAGMLRTLRPAALRNAWFALAAAGCLGAAWLCGANAGMPQVWTTALWLLLARVTPPPGLRAGSPAHLDWLFAGAGYSGLLWGAGFVVFVLLMLAFSGDPVVNAAGESTSSAPAWIFPLVWSPYFLAEALLRAWRRPVPAI